MSDGLAFAHTAGVRLIQGRAAVGDSWRTRAHAIGVYERPLGFSWNSVVRASLEESTGRYLEHDLFGEWLFEWVIKKAGVAPRTGTIGVFEAKFAEYFFFKRRET